MTGWVKVPFTFMSKIKLVLRSGMGLKLQRATSSGSRQDKDQESRRPAASAAHCSSHFHFWLLCSQVENSSILSNLSQTLGGERSILFVLNHVGVGLTLERVSEKVSGRNQEE